MHIKHWIVVIQIHKKYWGEMAMSLLMLMNQTENNILPKRIQLYFPVQNVSWLGLFDLLCWCYWRVQLLPSNNERLLRWSFNVHYSRCHTWDGNTFLPHENRQHLDSPSFFLFSVARQRKHTEDEYPIDNIIYLDNSV